MKLKLVISLTGILMLYGFTMKPSTDTTTGKEEMCIRDRSFKGKNVWLQLDGINYRAEVWVNGNLLSTINGMFIQDYINVTDFVKIGKNLSLIHIF